jgi:hypothetical protein
LQQPVVKMSLPRQVAAAAILLDELGVVKKQQGKDLCGQKNG